MDFDDLRADIDLECPHCNRKFQQEERQSEASASPECPACGGEVPADGTGAAERGK